jgi:hypothetical protein
VTHGPSEPRQRSWLEVRWRQFRHAPTPVVRAVVADLAVALIGGGLLLVYSQALARGLVLPGGDLLAGAVALFVLVVLVVGSWLTWLWVPQPGAPDSVRRRSAWSAMLGLLAALPIAYLVLVVVFQVLGPLLG